MDDLSSSLEVPLVDASDYVAMEDGRKHGAGSRSTVEPAGAAGVRAAQQVRHHAGLPAAPV